MEIEIYDKCRLHKEEGERTIFHFDDIEKEISCMDSWRDGLCHSLYIIII